MLVTTCARGNLRSIRTQRLCTTRGWHRPKEHQCAARKLIYEPKTPHSGNHKSNELHEQGCNRYVNEGLLATPTRHLNTALRTPLTPAQNAMANHKSSHLGVASAKHAKMHPSQAGHLKHPEAKQLAGGLSYGKDWERDGRTYKQHKGLHIDSMCKPLCCLQVRQGTSQSDDSRTHPAPFRSSPRAPRSSS